MLYCFKLLQSFSILAAISFSEASKLLVSTSAQRGPSFAEEGPARQLGRGFNGSGQRQRCHHTLKRNPATALPLLRDGAICSRRMGKWVPKKQSLCGRVSGKKKPTDIASTWNCHPVYPIRSDILLQTPERQEQKQPPGSGASGVSGSGSDNGSGAGSSGSSGSTSRSSSSSSQQCQ